MRTSILVLLVLIAFVGFTVWSFRGSPNGSVAAASSNIIHNKNDAVAITTPRPSRRRHVSSLRDEEDESENESQPKPDQVEGQSAAAAQQQQQQHNEDFGITDERTRAIALELRGIESAGGPALRQYRQLQRIIRRQARKHNTSSVLSQLRPHEQSYTEFWSSPSARLPVPSCAPRTSGPYGQVSEFCTPNIGRFWPSSARVFPLSYGIAAENFLIDKDFEELVRASSEASSENSNKKLVKFKDCSKQLPLTRVNRRAGTKQQQLYDSQEPYYAEMTASYFCIVHKKAGWESLRLYEIIAAGCMPYFIDLEYCPVMSVVFLPKQLLLEARSLPGVYFRCASGMVTIDHAVFPRAKYFSLLRQLREHALQHLTTKAMASFVLGKVAGFAKSTTPKVLYLVKRTSGSARKGRGSYSSWLLLHGLRTLLGDANVIDPKPTLKFLYKQYRASYSPFELYGKGFSYAFLLNDSSEIDRSGDMGQRVAAKEFDMVVFADPFAFAARSGDTLKLLDTAIAAGLPQNRILILLGYDVPFPDRPSANFDLALFYQRYSDKVTFLQRETSDCEYYVHPSSRTSGLMKRCVWHLTKNCFDDIALMKRMQPEGEQQQKEEQVRNDEEVVRGLW